MGDGPNDAGLSRHHIISGCEASLRRLRHRPHRPLPGARVGRPDAAGGDARGAATTWSHSGKVRYVGASNYAGWQLMKALGHRRARPAAALRQPADLLLAAGAHGRVRARPAARRPGPGHAGLEPARRRPALGQVPPRRRTAPAGSRHLTDWDEPPVYDEDKLYDTVEVLVEIAEGHGVSAAQVALAWLLRRPERHLGGRSARAPTSSSPTTCAPPSSTLTDEEVGAAGGGQPRRRCSTPTGIRRKTAADRLGPADLALLAPYL